MLSLHPNARYFVYQGYVNMLKSFNGLCGIVTNELRRDLLTGDVFIFFNKRKTCIKVLSWEMDGFSIYYKRLEKGTYEFTPHDADGKSTVISYSQLLLILQGISLTKAHYRPRYKKKEELSTPETFRL